jgi:outer membrane usher protein
LGGFLNYDLLAERSNGSTQTSGLFELGMFSGYGVGIGSFIANNAGPARHFTRLETTWTIDSPERLASLRIGDSIARAGMWGRGVRFGGIQYATNFMTQPGLVTLPLQGVAGQAVLPSTVDVYVNNALTSQRQVAPGPFSINNVPVVTGQGDVRVVVRDVLGREQIITQSFYASASLLAAGMQDFSYELGSVRRDFGIASNDYGSWFAAATHRKGFTDQFTGEVHAEVQADQQTLGVGGVFLVHPFGTLNASMAASRSRTRSGGFASLGIERMSALFNFGARAQVASPDFVQLGQPSGTSAPRLQANINVGIPVGRYGSLGMAFVAQDNRDTKIQLVSASYNVGLGRFGFLNVGLSKVIKGAGPTSFGVNWSLPLGPRTIASANLTQQQGNNNLVAQVQQSLPAGDGFGYFLQAGKGTQDATVLAQTSFGTYRAEAAYFQGQTGVRLGAAGGVSLLGGSVNLSRRITDSFALVQVPGFPNVRVYADNQLAGRTNANGEAMLPRLRAYESNPISIEQLDLPFDATVGALALDAVPYFRSGMLLEFPVSRSRGAMLTIDLENGHALPAGAVVKIAGQAQAFPVGHGGSVYLTGLSAQNRLRATWRNRNCDIEVPFTEGPDPLPDLGRFVCKGVTP